MFEIMRLEVLINFKLYWLATDAAKKYQKWQKFIEKIPRNNLACALCLYFFFKF